MTRAERILFRSLTEREQRLLAVLNEYEQGTLILTPELVAALKASSLSLVAFACLGTKSGCEEIVANINNTILFQRFRKRMRRLLEALQAIDPATTVDVFLPDLEPQRTWGWESDQDEVTLACMIMRDEADLSSGWNVHLWSETEERYGHNLPGYAEALQGAEGYTRSQIVDEETRFFRELGVLHPGILTKGRPREIALRQLAAYAHEGRVLEQLYPRSILLQADAPTDRKDAMFGPLRTVPLPIIHPFIRE